MVTIYIQYLTNNYASLFDPRFYQFQQDDPIDHITRNGMPPLVIVSSSNTKLPSSPSLKKKHVTMRDSEEVTKLHQFESNQNVDSVPSRELASCTTTSLTTLTTGTAGAACDVKTLCGNFFKIDATEKISITKLAFKPRLTGSQTIEIWARLGEYNGYTSSTTGWSRIYAATINVPYTLALTSLKLSTARVVGAGTSHSFHIRSTLGLKYTSDTGNTGSQTTPYAENCALKIYWGKAGRFGTYPCCLV